MGERECRANNVKSAPLHEFVKIFTIGFLAQEINRERNWIKGVPKQRKKHRKKRLFFAKSARDYQQAAGQPDD